MHIPVLLDEVISAFSDLNISAILDGTLGLGGHAKALLEKHPEILKYIGIDRDTEAQAIAKENLKDYQNKMSYYQGNYSEYQQAIQQAKVTQLDAILLDLGVSSMQLDTPKRGFSFRFEGPLDMRMDLNQTLTAAIILNTWSEEQIADILYYYGEIHASRRWARAICELRDLKPFETIQDLLSMRVPARSRSKKIHPFTLVFQALRIAVNDELSHLPEIIEGLFSTLSPNGRLAVISFHSLEDRIVKRKFQSLSKKHSELLGTGDLKITEAKGTLISRKGFEASKEELQENPRSRSARLRIIEKI